MPPVTRRETGTQDSTAALSSADSNLFHEEVDRAAIRLGPTEHNRAPALTRQYSDLFLNDHAEHTRSSKRSEDTQHRVTAGMAYVDQVGVETECVVQNVRWERQRYSKGEVCISHRGRFLTSPARLLGRYSAASCGQCSQNPQAQAGAQDSGAFQS
jgi:hypothetical protein